MLVSNLGFGFTSTRVLSAWEILEKYSLSKGCIFY